MPRIDPFQLLKCLSVLLTPEGGILSTDEVPRLVNLMTKFSKKLVSKCVYVLILKSTKIELVDMFMSEGGWTLIQTWLQDAVHTANWHLVKEILGLLLITPVDVERLKLNILPKLIKSLSRRDDVQDVADLSTQLVKQWLVIVKGSSGVSQGHDKEIAKFEPEIIATINEGGNIIDEISTSTFYKKGGEKDCSNKDDQILNEVMDVEMKDVSTEKTKPKEEHAEDKHKSSSKSSRSTSSSRDKDKSKDKYRDKDKSRSSSSSKSSSSKSRSSSSSSRDKDRKDRDKDREKEKDKDKQRDKSKEKDKHRNNGSVRSSSSSSNSSKEKKDIDLKKDKSVNDIVKPSIEKLGRIPKKSSSINDVNSKENKETSELKKKTFSVGIKKDVTTDERPKTVKVFNSRMRSTGLEEEAKPAPSRISTKKTTPPPTLPTIPLKRASPTKDIVLPPEKKLKIDKIDIPDRPGAIKLIPPKPKPMLQESDLFNDALTAATSKKEPKKRKRRASTSKDTPSSPTTSPTQEHLSTPSSPLGIKNIAPINFYQDTLSQDVEEANENKENGLAENSENLDDSVVSTISENKENEIRSPRAVTPTDDDPEELKKLKIEGVPKGVLMYTKKKGPKKSISWKNDTDLVEIRYFELDETERVNVTKAFNDMAKMDISNEREALQLSRKVGGEDLMEPQIVWRIPFEIDVTESLIVPGHRSLEKDIQFAREKSVLQALYFDKRKIPDTPEEPIPENHQMSDPVIIQLEDPESQEIDLKNTPWPEPKGNAPLPEPQVPMVYPTIPVPFNPQFSSIPPPNFPNQMPRFPGPVGPMIPPIPNNFVPPNLMPNGSMMPPPNLLPPNEMMMNQMNPNMFPGGPIPDGFGPGPGPGPEPDFPMFGNPNGPPNNMFPPNNFRHNRGGGFRRGRGGNNDNGNWVRMSGPGGNWRRGGGGNRGGRLCKNIQNHGYCRNGDNCPFIHP